MEIKALREPPQPEYFAYGREVMGSFLPNASCDRVRWRSITGLPIVDCNRKANTIPASGNVFMFRNSRVILRSGNAWATSLGLDLRRMVSGLANLPWFATTYLALLKQNSQSTQPWRISCARPCLHDREQESGTASGHYFHQDLLVAQRIFKRAPAHHCDVGSRIDGFVAHVAAFSAIEVFDFRILNSNTPNIRYRQLDLFHVPPALEGYTDSLSCLHALEHFGLARYGDSVDINGHERGFDGLYRMLREGGMLYFSVPVGEERIVYNSHRVFSIETLMQLFANRFEIVSFSFVDDSGALTTDLTLNDANIKKCNASEFGCAIFELRKATKNSTVRPE